MLAREHIDGEGELPALSDPVLPGERAGNPEQLLTAERVVDGRQVVVQGAHAQPVVG
jgi:hypothetical protein